MELATIADAGADPRLVDLWLHGRPASTQRSYRIEAARFLAFVDRPLSAVTLADLQAFADQLGHLAPTSRAHALAAVKSLLGFGHRLGILRVDVGRALKVAGGKETLAERILPEAAVHRMIALEPDPRNALLLRLTYAAGLRVSEACGLRWRDLQPREDGGQVTILGKGNKTRAVLLPPALWDDLFLMVAMADPDAPVFRSHKGGALHPSQALRVVRAAAARAGVGDRVSPHWLRHAHASHALDRGAPIHLVQATLGHVSVATTGRYLHARPSDSSARYLAV